MAQMNVYLGDDDKADSLMEQIDRFRRLEGKTWKAFVFLSMAGHIARDNPALAREIIEFITEPRDRT